MPGRVGAVDQRVDPARLELAHEPLDREDSPVGLVTWSTSASRVRGVTAREHRLERPLRRGEGERQCGHDDPGAGARGDGLQRVPAGVVGVVRGEELVARREIAATGAPC